MMQWNGQQIIDRARAVHGARVQAAAIHLVNEIRKMISVSSRSVSFKTGRSGKIRKVLGARGSNRSRPGTPPHKDTGRLRQSITYSYDPNRMVARVGTALSYGKYLELGTKKMRPRPFLRTSLAENRETIRQIIAHGQQLQISVGGGQ